jgi:hypothetical protein
VSTIGIETESKSAVKVDLTPVWITGLPIPPSSNTQYTPWLNRKTGKMSFIPSRGLKEYKLLIRQAFHKNPTLFIQNIKKLQSWVDNGVYFEVKATFFFEKSRILTLKNSPKKLDVQNREKALFDGIATLLSIDDSLFFKTSAEKRIVSSGESDTVTIEINPYFIDL